MGFAEGGGETVTVDLLDPLHVLRDELVQSSVDST